MSNLSKRKRVIFSILTCGFLVVVAEVSLQLYYRISVGMWLWQWWGIPIYETDPVRVYRVKGNLDFLHKTREYTARYYTNPLGMRTDERRQVPDIPKPANTFRILALGPSFTFGWGVNQEDSYMYRIANGLKVPGKKVELINLGTPAQPPSYQLKWLRQVGYRYQPDLLIQTVYGEIAGIDTDDTIPDNGPCVKDGYLYPAPNMTFAMWIRRTRKYSALLFYGWYAYRAVFASDPAAVGDGREFYRKVDIQQSYAQNQTVQNFKQYIKFVHNVLTNKPPVVFLFIPLSFVVRPADVIRVAHHGSRIDPFEKRRALELLSRTLNSNQVDMIDPTSALAEKDKKARMYNLFDVHLTKSGNEAVADFALPHLQALLDGQISNRP